MLKITLGVDGMMCGMCEAMSTMRFARHFP